MSDETPRDQLPLRRHDFTHQFPVPAFEAYDDFDQKMDLAVDRSLDPNEPNELKPFFVVITQVPKMGGYHRPGRLLVFARDDAHAEKRVRDAIQCAAQHEAREKNHDPYQMGTRLLDGRYFIVIQPFDIRTIVNLSPHGLL